MSGMDLLLQAAAYSRPNYVPVATVESSPALITKNDTTNLKKRDLYYSSTPSSSRSTDSVMLMSSSLPPKKRRMINFHDNTNINNVSGSASSISAASNSAAASSSVSGSGAGSFLPQLLQTNDNTITTSQPASQRSTVSVSSTSSHNSHASNSSNYSHASHYSNGSRYTESPIQTIAYPPRPRQPQAAAAAAVVTARNSFIHHLCNTVIVPNTHTTNTIRPNAIRPKKPVLSKKTAISHGLKLKRNNRMTLASKLNKKRNPRNPLVKDVDGNDMCMGYFSMPTAQRRSAPPVEEDEIAVPSAPESDDDDEEEAPSSKAVVDVAPPDTDSTIEVATSLYTRPEKEMASAISAKSRLYQAYLRALDR